MERCSSSSHDNPQFRQHNGMDVDTSFGHHIQLAHVLLSLLKTYNDVNMEKECGRMKIIN
jgi:hypothetical protein